MNTFETGTRLDFHVTITRAPGEDWPPLDTGTQRWDVTQVAILVQYREDEGELSVDMPYVRKARRIRKDGSPGAVMTSQFTSYSGYWIRDPGEKILVSQQERLFRQAALAAAQDAFAALTRQHIPAGS